MTHRHGAQARQAVKGKRQRLQRRGAGGEERKEEKAGGGREAGLAEGKRAEGLEAEGVRGWLRRSGRGEREREVSEEGGRRISRRTIKGQPEGNQDRSGACCRRCRRDISG